MEPVNTVLLIDDHALFRKGVAQLIQMNPAFRVVGEASSGRVGVDLAVRLKPDVVLIDLNMPEMSGIETLEMMKQHNVDARFLMLTVSDNERDVVAALRAGAKKRGNVCVSGDTSALRSMPCASRAACNCGRR